VPGYPINHEANALNAWSIGPLPIANGHNPEPIATNGFDDNVNPYTLPALKELLVQLLGDELFFFLRGKLSFRLLSFEIGDESLVLWAVGEGGLGPPGPDRLGGLGRLHRVMFCCLGGDLYSFDLGLLYS
jgi:hypothetical protein